MADAALVPVARPPAPVRKERVGGTSLGLRTIAIAYVGLLVLVPVAVLLYRALKPGFGEISNALSEPQTQHAFQVSLVVAISAVVIDTVFGIAVAILLVRYRFPGRRLLSAFIDLPIAVSPIVVGLALILVYSPSGWFGSVVQDQVINAKPGMVLATVFVSLPLVARAIIPVLEQAGLEQDQAAASLGANALTRFMRITLPTIRVALAYGVVLALARCLGEYGAVLVVSGNIIGQTETAPLHINTDLQNFDDNGAYAIALVLMLIAFAAILAGAYIRRRQRRGTT